MTAARSPTGRWVASRKAALLDAIDRGEITEADACARHALSPEELAAWRSGRAWNGLDGLKRYDCTGGRLRYRERRP